MATRILSALALAVVVGGMGWSSLVVAQTGTATISQPAKADPAREAARQQVLQSERWLRARHDLNQWLSIQKLYTPQEVAVLRKEFQARVDRMSPQELEVQLTDMEAKLAVLASPEAEDARRWLAQFLAVQAKYTPEQLRAKRPDVARMTASQIQLELAKFQQRRGGVQQSQAAIEQGRALQVQNSRNMQTARQQAAEQARQSASRAAQTAAERNRIPPPNTNLPGFSAAPVGGVPTYTVGPWGHPIRWDPFSVW
jgi:hypothetical protein